MSQTFLGNSLEFLVITATSEKVFYWLWTAAQHHQQIAADRLVTLPPRSFRFWVLSKVLSTVRATKKAPGVRLTHWGGVLTADRQRQLCPSDQNCRTIGPVTESRTTFATSPLVTKHNAGKTVVKKVVLTHWWHCTSSPLSRWATQNYFVRTVQRSDSFNECSVLLGIFFLFRKKLHSFSHNTTCTKMWIIV